jgi:hypothetical protein
MHFVRGQLFALSAATKNDAEVGFSIAYETAHSCTDGWVINTLGGVSTEIFHIVTLIRQHRNEVLLQGVPGVVGSDCYTRHVFQSSRGAPLTT